MRIPFYGLIAALFLLAGLTSTAFAQGGTRLYFPGTPVSGGGTGRFNNLNVGPGSISIVGGSGSGTDRIDNVNINGVQNVMAWGAKCDGVTDDTVAFMNAHTAANNGGTVMIPSNKTCVVSTLDWHDSTRTLIYGMGATLQFTGVGAPCSNGSGGLWRLGGSGTGFDTIQGLTITAPNEAWNGCTINTSTADSDPSDLESVRVTGVTATGPGIFWYSHRATVLNMDHNIIWNPIAFQGVVGTTWDAHIKIEDNVLQGGSDGSFSSHDYGQPVVIINGWTENPVIERNRFEECLGGNCVQLATMYGGSVSHNSEADGFGTRPWAANTAQPHNTCVIPNGGGADPTYVSDTSGVHTYIFCNLGAQGTTGPTEPNFGGVTMGGTINDGGVMWTLTGRGIGYWIQQANGGNVDGNDTTGWAANVWMGLIGSFTGVDNGGEVSGNASGSYFNIVDNMPNLTSRSNFFQTNGNPGAPTSGGTGGYAFYAFANAIGFISQQEICSQYGSFNIKWTAAAGGSGIILGFDQNPGGTCAFSYTPQNVNVIDARWPKSPTNSGTQTYFMASATPIPVCGPATHRQYACVFDGAGGCPAGTVYAGGAGGYACQVQCQNSGSNWMYTGQQCY